jgi:hypothetical protein
MLVITFAKLFLQVSCSAPFFLALLIQAARNFSGSEGIDVLDSKEHILHFFILYVHLSDLGSN